MFVFPGKIVPNMVLTKTNVRYSASMKAHEFVHRSNRGWSFAALFFSFRVSLFILEEQKSPKPLDGAYRRRLMNLRPSVD